MLCIKCGGTGRYLGTGMMTVDCKACDDGFVSEESIAEKSKPENVKIDKRSQSYKNSIKEIMELNPKISRAEAVKMFDDAYDKV